MSRTRSSLLERIRNLEDGPSWEEFDRLYRPLLLRYALDRGLHRDEADEIAQQCMAAIAGGIQGFQRRVSLRGWLRGMVDHKVDDQLRRRRHEAPARTADFQTEQAREDNPAQLWERQWNRTHLLYCLNLVRDEISPLTYEAFERYVIREQPVGEITERLGMTANQVYVAKHRVIERLKKRWTELAEGLI